jgi:acyl-CoA synthetase (NDP forming)/GNAT superfamily N-acetyltransferase
VDTAPDVRPSDSFGTETWEADVVLSDGGTVHVRPIQPTDAEAFKQFHAQLSPQSVYYRYFSPKPRLTDAEIERFTTVDMLDRAALVALLGDDIVADARYDRWPGKPEAEVAFAVVDSHQGRGLSTLLLEHLAAIARLNGIVRFTAEVLADNRAMLSVFARAGWPVTRAFDSGVVDVAFDVVPTPAYLDTVERREQQAESRSIARLLRPKSVAVVGASDKPASVGQALLRGLLRSGFPGPVFAVNPARERVSGLPCYARLTDVPEDVALAIVAVPPDQVEGVLEDAIAKHVRGLVMVTGDFARTTPGEPSAVQHLVARARGNGMRIIGPASMGLLSTAADVPLRAVLAPTIVAAGGVSISLQSGPLGTGILELAARLGVGLASFVSLGDKADVSGNDLLQYWEDDPATRVVLVYTESFGNPRKFARIARRVSRHKPIVAVRAGGTADPTTEALYEQAGVIRVRTVRELFDTARVLDRLPLPRGDRLMVVGNAASPAILALDAAKMEGLVPAVLGVDIANELLEPLPEGSTLDEGVVQLTHRAMPADFGHAVKTLLAAGDVDAILVIFAPPLPDVATIPKDALREVEDVLDKPLVAVMVGFDDGPLAPGSRIPVFAFPEPAVGALGRIARHVRAHRTFPPSELTTPEGIDEARVRAVLDHALEVRPEGTLLPLAAAEELLSACGIRVASAHAITSVDAAITAAEELGYPVALKAAKIVRSGRSERAGVALDLHDAGEVRRAWSGIEDELGPGALTEAIVQCMAPPGVELRVKVEPHPPLGAVLTFGLGGVFADAIGDEVPRLVPFLAGEAAAVIGASRAARALIDDEARRSAEDLLERVAHLADAHPEVESLLINPVLASRGGSWVTDVSVHVRPAVAHADTPLRRLGPR